MQNADHTILLLDCDTKLKKKQNKSTNSLYVDSSPLTVSIAVRTFDFVVRDGVAKNFNRLDFFWLFSKKKRILM